MMTPQSAAPADASEFDDEIIDLEPTVSYSSSDASIDLGRPSPQVALVDGTMASISGETEELRRQRLLSTSIFLTGLYLTLSAWLAFSPNRDFGFILLSMGARLLLLVTAVVLLLRVRLSNLQIRVVEFGLFGGLTAILAVVQYLVNLDLIRDGDRLAAITYAKNGVMQLFTLMILYGTFIPNDWRTTARVVCSMALTLALSFTLLLEHPDLADFVHELRTGDQIGSSVLGLAIGAVLSTYGAYVLNGLRAELHEAKRFGQYQLREKLGAGGMGEVYFAEHQLLKRPCALKLIRPGAGADPLALARFEREVQSAAQLSHPNTIEIYDYGHTSDGTFYYVMEYLPGMNLSDLVHRAGPLPAGRVIHLFRQACGGLAEAHGLGLVHRDLKPANLFVAVRGGEYDVAKVLDFGLVKVNAPGVSELTTDNTVSGTPVYMPPEQATGTRDIDGRTDLYALGAMAYFALTGQPPFAGETAFVIMMAHARDPVVPPSQIRPDVPADLEAVVLRCLEKKPEDRYPDARSLAKALAACAAAADWDSEKAEQWWHEFYGATPAAKEVAAS